MRIPFETPNFTDIFESASKKLESEEKDPQEKKLENELEITEDHFEKLRICNLILEINQDSTIARFTQIKSYLELDHLEKAFEIASDILSKIKKFPGTNNNSELNIAFNLVCAGIKSIEKKYEESLIFLDEGLRFDENHLTLLTGKGECLLHLKKYTEAIEYYKKALDVDPDNLQIMEGIAHAYTGTEEKQIAIDYYDKILKIDPNNMDIQTYRIVCLDKLKENLELLSIINEKLKIDENNQDLLINKAILLSNMKKFKEAEECFDKILINNDLEILVDIRKHFKKTTAVDENNKLAKDNLVK